MPHIFSEGKIEREKKTIAAMMDIFCRELHGTNLDLCLDCAALLAYCRARLDQCPFQEEKSTCANCLVHCYKPEMRERVRQVMRFAGPRMMKRHPLSALLHLLSGWRRPRTLAEIKAKR